MSFYPSPVSGTFIHLVLGKSSTCQWLHETSSRENMRPKNRPRGFSPNQISSITNKTPYLQEAWTLSLSHTHCVSLRIKTETESTKVQLYLIDTIIEHLKKKTPPLPLDKLTSPENKTKQKCAWYTQQTEPDQVSLGNRKSILEINGYSAFLTHTESERERQRESLTLQKENLVFRLPLLPCPPAVRPFQPHYWPDD